MKINIVSDKKRDLTGYTNINYDSVSELNEVCEDGEAVELMLDDVVGCLVGNKVPYYLNLWMKKVAVGGQIIVMGVDAEDLVRCFYTNLINITDFNILIYGDQDFSIKRNSILSGNEIAALLRASGFKILKNNIINIKYVVVAERII